MEEGAVGHPDDNLFQYCTQSAPDGASANENSSLEERFHVDTVVAGDGNSTCSTGTMYKNVMYAVGEGGQHARSFW